MFYTLSNKTNKEKPYSDLLKINVLLYKAIAFTSLYTRIETTCS